MLYGLLFLTMDTSRAYIFQAVTAVSAAVAIFFYFQLSQTRKLKKKEFSEHCNLNGEHTVNLCEAKERMRNKHLATIDDVEENELLALLYLAQNFEKLVEKKENTKYLENKLFCCLFLEPSTRTVCSFNAAIAKLGSQVININEVKNTSFYKGESIEDAIKVLGSYVDGIIYRDSSEDNIFKAMEATSTPIINAGNGSDEHPTQSLLDFYTIFSFFPKILERKEELVISFVGDLKYGRTVHSLCKLLSRYNVRFQFVSCKSLELPKKLNDVIIENLKKNGFYKEQSILKFDKMESGVKDAHIVYMTRIQKERFVDANEYNMYKDAFILSKLTLQCMLKDAIILHPLPRVNEITPDVDDDSRSKYFIQSQKGLYMRMALLYLIHS